MLQQILEAVQKNVQCLSALMAESLAENSETLSEHTIPEIKTHEALEDFMKDLSAKEYRDFVVSI